MRSSLHTYTHTHWVVLREHVGAAKCAHSLHTHSHAHRVVLREHVDAAKCAPPCTHVHTHTGWFYARMWVLQSALNPCTHVHTHTGWFYARLWVL